MKKNRETEDIKEEKKKRPLISKLIILLLFLAIIYIYARYVGTTGILIREYNIKDELIPESFDGFKIVQFSDMELGTTFNVEDIKVLVEKINKLEPQIVVFTGDLVNSSYQLSDKEIESTKDSLALIDPLIGKYYVLGDDDVGKNADEILDAAGFKNITNDYELIYYKGLTPIVMYGLDSLTKGTQDYEKTFAYPEENTDSSYMASYRILLAHEPDTIDHVSDYNISLMLAGHSHNSEINIPYLKTLYHIEGASKYYDDKYNVGGTQLYISSGLGSSKYKVRLFSRPSISIFRLYRD